MPIDTVGTVGEIRFTVILLLVAVVALRHSELDVTIHVITSP